MTVNYLSSIALRDTLGSVSRYHGSLKEYVLARRGILGITPTELARRSGLSKADISNYEHGKTDLPSPEKRRALVAALNGFHAELLVACGQITPEEIIEGANAYDPQRAKAVSPFGTDTPAARITDLMKSMTDADLIFLLSVAEYAASRRVV